MLVSFVRMDPPFPYREGPHLIQHTAHCAHADCIWTRAVKKNSERSMCLYGNRYRCQFCRCVAILLSNPLSPPNKIRSRSRWRRKGKKKKGKGSSKGDRKTFTIYVCKRLRDSVRLEPNPVLCHPFPSWRDSVLFWLDDGMEGAMEIRAEPRSRPSQFCTRGFLVRGKSSGDWQSPAGSE